MELFLVIICAVGIIQMLRKLLETKQRLPAWDRILANTWIVSILYFVIYLYRPFSSTIILYCTVVYLFILITVFLLRNYRPALFDSAKSTYTDRVYVLRNYYPARPLLIALLPIGLVTLFTYFSQYQVSQFYRENSSHFQTATAIAIFWAIGFGVYAILQINKEKKIRFKMQEEELIAEARKAELERLVTERTNELIIQNEKLQLTLVELKATQTQLVHAEKMAGLGELTAGIAHEIQNPLNFVNNFSEVNNELIEELKSETSRLRTEEGDQILNNIFLNNEKITFHGKRADAIVKSMLQHSRSSSDKKEPTDINALCDEYLRLGYHSFRAKEKSFNAKLETDFDSSIQKIDAVPQEIGRVILNLVNNAFYAVNEKAKKLLAGYEPLVIVSTKELNGIVEIRVRDNGTGISDATKKKIFQPFFTTKPTGQGAGLGLSLSHDIITKGHGGEIEVNTKENEGTEFIIVLPI